MPCNAVATVSSKLKCDASLLLENEQGLNAAKVVIAKAVGIDANRVRTYKSGTVTVFDAGSYSIRIDKTGNITVSGSSYTRQGIRDITEKITAALSQVAGLMLQLKIKQAIMARASITSEQRAPNGSTVITFSL